MLGDLIMIVVLLVAFSVVTIAASILLVIKFGHPDDKNEALWPKTVVIAGLFLAGAAVFVFPLDVASTADPRLRHLMSYVWYGIFSSVAVMLLLVVPVSVSAYEDADRRNRCGSIAFGLVPLVLIAVVAVCLYPFFSSYTLSANDAEKLTGTLQPSTQITIDYLLFAVAVLAMIGWAAFVIFVPVGLIVLPMDLINAFLTRPKPMTVADYGREKVQIGKAAARLLSLARDEQQAREQHAANGKAKLSRADRRIQIGLEIGTYELKKRQAFLEEAYELRGGNPLWYLLQLVMGIVFLLVTASWIVHTTVFLLFGASAGLNGVLADLQAVPVAGVAYFAVHALYLLAAAVKGAFRLSLGSRRLSIYPMEVGNTLMNAFLVNVWLVLALVFPLVQFCARSFRGYARDTFVESVMVRIDALPLFQSFVFYQNIYLYVMGGVMFLTLLVTLVCPRNTARQIGDRLRSRIELSDR